MEINALTPVAYSSVYETPAWGFQSDIPFFNSVVEVETALEPIELLKVTQGIELEMGRMKTPGMGYESRIIDIDILFIDKKVINIPELHVPHRLMNERKFALVPMAELNALKTNPLTGLSVEEHLQNCDDPSEISLVVTNIDFAKKIEQAAGQKKK